jgi:flagellar motor switch protein FliG
MSLTARHKRPGGFKALINSLELTPPERREKILNAMKREDPKFVVEVEKCIFNFSEFVDIPDMVITDVVFGMKDDMRSVAVALYKCKDEALLNKFVKNMLPAQAAIFREELKMLDQITVAQQNGARFKMIEKARELQDGGTIMIKKYSSVFL